MTRKHKPYPILENVTIEAVAAEGKSLFHHEDKVVFVPFCVPGDIVDVQITRKKHSFMEGKVVKVIEYSKIRETPMCAHFGICGGCKWQNLPYEEQLKAKQQQVYDQLTRIGKIALPEFNPIMGSVKTKEYRNKLEFGCANKRWYTRDEIAAMPPREEGTEGNLNESAIGFHITGAFDKIYPIEKCWLMDDLHNQIRNEINRYAKEQDLAFYDIRAQHGLLRDLMMRNSNTGEFMLLVQFHYDEEGDEEKAMALLQHIANAFPQITSLIYVDNQKGNDTFGDLELTTFKGTDFIYETMEDLKFKVGPKSFYQTNTEQAYHLYSVARAFAALTGKELVPEAIEDAKENSKVNGIDNTLFYAGDMKNILTDDFIHEHGRPDVIITDPPRAGMHPDVVQVILNAAPKRVVYVSCNPATQARDLQLMDADYKVTAVQPVDMFPHTPHVENVVLLERR